jgi:prophage regulatory protein
LSLSQDKECIEFVLLNMEVNFMHFKQPFVRQHQLAEALGVSTVTLWNWRKAGILPEPVQLGPRFVGWKREVINEWLENR